MKNLLSIMLLLVPAFLTQAQTNDISCATLHNEESNDFSERGGKYLTASGELKVLVVFAKFKDDHNPHQFWPEDFYPSEMNNFIDPDMQKGSTHYLNLTNYYNQMSFGKFKVTGKAIGVETSYPISHYIPRNETYPDRSLANKDVLQAIDDSIDYTEFDNWTYIDNYNQVNVPDGIVDMVIVIWRGLVFSNGWSGEASLGRGSAFRVENNTVRILMSFAGHPSLGIVGSGVTVQYWGEKSRKRNFKVAIHEVAHWLLHGWHPYSDFNHTFWGMLTLANEGICTNAIERDMLDWIDPISIESNIQSALMGDYITTASAYKYHPGNGYQNEMYYFENHQRLSIYDNGTSNVNDKGIFILHLKDSTYMNDCVRLITSDGFWNWKSPYSNNCWGNNMPALKKVSVNRNGKGNRDRISLPNSISTFLYSYINNDEQAECNDWLHGYGFTNAFNTTFNDVFSNWSNPPAKTWDGQSTDFIMEVIDQSESIVTARFTIENSIGGKPSKPPLGWDPRRPDSLYQDGWIYLSWGADFWDGHPIEPDVNWSELQSKDGSGAWNTIYSGSNRYWSDGTINHEPDEAGLISFRVRVRNSQNKWSIWSDIFEIKVNVSDVPIVKNNAKVNLSDFRLYQNYPNPFNPTTNISFRITNFGLVSLKVYDLLGNEIATLVNEYKSAGSYEIEFEASELSSGVYIYQLKTGEFIEIQKMVLMK